MDLDGRHLNAVKLLILTEFKIPQVDRIAILTPVNAGNLEYPFKVTCKTGTY